MLRLRAHAGRVADAPLARVVGILVWAGVGWQAAYWLLQAWGMTAPVVPALPPVSPEPVVVERIARALGEGAASLAAPARVSPVPAGASAWHVVGVVAGAQGSGAVVLKREGEAARAVRVGAVLPDGTRVEQVQREQVRLRGPGGEVQELALPGPTP
jgi:hypothetical protein